MNVELVNWLKNDGAEVSSALLNNVEVDCVEKTLAYRAYLCLAHVCNMLSDDYTYFGSDNPYNDVSVFANSITELTGTQITQVFNLPGFERARLYHDHEYDVYFLVHPPTRPDSVPDQLTNVQVAENSRIPELFQEAAELIQLVRPEFRAKIVLTGHSLGGGLAAYSALSAANAASSAVHPLTFAFDPLGLNQSMLSGKRFRGVNKFIDWYPIDKSLVPLFNAEKFLSSIGNVQVLEADPLRVAQGLDSHDLENVRHGLRRRWEINPTWRQRQIDLVHKQQHHSGG